MVAMFRNLAAFLEKKRHLVPNCEKNDFAQSPNCYVLSRISFAAVGLCQETFVRVTCDTR